MFNIIVVSFPMSTIVARIWNILVLNYYNVKFRTLYVVLFRDAGKPGASTIN